MTDHRVIVSVQAYLSGQVSLAQSAKVGTPIFVKGLVGSDLDGQDGGPSVSSGVWPCAQWRQFTSQWRTVLCVSVETITNNRMSSTGSPMVASHFLGFVDTSSET